MSLDVDDGGALRTTRPTSFELEIAIDGVSIGEDARLAEVFGVEGAAEPDESMFTSERLTFRDLPAAKAIFKVIRIYIPVRSAGGELHG